jgi:hypothetical protein
MALSFAKLAFTPTVRAEQEKRGSAEGYAKFLSDERQGGDVLTMAEAAFLTERDGVLHVDRVRNGLALCAVPRWSGGLYQAVG